MGEPGVDDGDDEPNPPRLDPRGYNPDVKSDKMKIAGLIIQSLTLFLVTVLVVILVILPRFTTPTATTPSTTPDNSSNCTCSREEKLPDGVSQFLDSTIVTCNREDCKSFLPVLDGVSQLEVTSNASAEKFNITLYDIISSLANLRESVTTTSGGAVNHRLLAVEVILDIIQNKTFLLDRILSCKDVKSVYPTSPSGYYHINGCTVYCNMDTLCGSGGGWTRIGYLDMTDATQSCPAGYKLYESGNVRACGRTPHDGPSCTPSVKFDPNGIGYSEICGRVIGYQFGSPDALAHHDINNHLIPASPAHNDINSHYVDGVSITRGSPRQHVWTFICGVSDTINLHVESLCPCNKPPPGALTIPSFVGNNYFCESGNQGDDFPPLVLYTDDPLWDGEGCGSLEGPCCAAPGLPWFHRDYGNTITTDFIELRVCCDESTNNEDVPISFYEIYVK